MIEEPGQKLKRVRERLDLRVRDVEEASLRLAQRHGSDEYAIPISRLSDIENKGVVPTIFRVYTLSAVYRLELTEILQWYGIDLGQLPADAATVSIDRTHPIGFQSPAHGSALFPLALDPGIDPAKTTYLSRLIQRWGTLPLVLLSGLDPKNHRYAFIGSEDWSMYPILHPGSLVQIDESRRRIVNAGWTTEFDRPIYFLENREGFACSWCSQEQGRIILLSHPSTAQPPKVFAAEEIDIIGQVCGIAMQVDPDRRRRTHF